MKILSIIIFILVIYYFSKLNINKSKSSLSNGDNTCPVVNAPNFSTVNDPINDIDIQPIGCFTHVKDLFFISCINPYSNDKISDSGKEIVNYPNDIVNLIKQVIKNGYDLYGNNILNKYRGTDYSNLSLIEFGTLSYLCGYKYMSILSNGTDTKNEIFISYSQPMGDLTDNNNNIAQSDLPTYTLIPMNNNDAHENNIKPGNELSCGYPCSKDGKPQTFLDDKGILRQYMCGSVVYPTIKTPPRYAVYKIFEKK